MDEISILIQIILLLGLSAVCSGLNLSLMSLNVSDLKRKARGGNADAKRILPLRQNGHLSLASILLTNVAVVSTTSLVLEHRFNSLVAGVASTILIVVFGEILPQAFFMRNALSITAFFAPLLKLMTIVTYPVAKPLQLLLDKMFGVEAEHLHSRQELGLIISEHIGEKTSELDEDEVEIIRGALQLSEKRVRDIYTPLKHVYWLTPDTVIDAARIDEIKAQNWSRIPILSTDRMHVRGMLLMKDLVDIDFDEEPRAINKLRLHKTRIVGSMTALDTLFRTFINSHTHLLPVERDDKIIGIVTIEDLIEEIIGHEIEDESDHQSSA